MSESTTINLATVGTAELEAMSVPVFASCLDSMSGEAIVRFKRMRKLSASHRSALEKYLIEHPEKRPGGEADMPASKTAPAEAKSKKVKKKAGATPPKATKPKGVDRRSSFPDFKKRLSAWWVGVEVKDLDTFNKRHAKAPAPTKAKPTRAPAAPAAPSMNKAEMLQMVWGDGYMLPGGDDFALRLVEGLAFGEGLACLDMTAGLGGGTSAVARHHKIIVEGLQIDPGLAKVAQDLLTVRDMAAIAPIRCGNPLSEKLEDGKYGAIFMRETLFTNPDRKTLLRNVAKALAPSGSLVLTDFMLANRNAGTPGMEAWQQAEPIRALPFTMDEYATLLGQAHFEVRSHADLSAEYIGFIQAGWRRLYACLQAVKLSPETANMLMIEGNLWLARSKALESGELRLVSMRCTLIPT